jgi:hypothetical protein
MGKLKSSNAVLEDLEDKFALLDIWPHTKRHNQRLSAIIVRSCLASMARRRVSAARLPRAAVACIEAFTEELKSTTERLEA